MKKVKYLRQGESFNYDYELMLPEPLASWDVFDYWERERVESMRENLNKDDILFDVGAEHGWMSVVFAKFCKVFLIEPTKEFWPNIYQTWRANNQYEPVGCYSGLLSNKTTDSDIKSFSWPDEIEGVLLKAMKYQLINDKPDDVKELTLDDLVKRSGIIPTGVTIDVEGAELLVLQGAKKTLENNAVKVWVSIHPDLMKKNFDHKPSDIHIFMERLGYLKKYLATDHERHYYYSKK